MSLPIVTDNAQPIEVVQSTIANQESQRALTATPQTTHLPSLMLAERVTAQVVNRPGPNQLSVLIKNALFILSFPPGTAIEKRDNLALKVASLHPTLTFLLVGDNGLSNCSAYVTLSRTSRYLMQLLATERPPDPVIRLNVAHHHPDKVALELKTAIGYSGLFYESHLKAVLEGQARIEQIKQEPQAHLTPLPADTTAAPYKTLQTLGHLVQRQLHSQETQQLHFQCLAWPQQPVTLTIAREKPEAGHNAQSKAIAPSWRTQLILQLPTLGTVVVYIRLMGTAVQTQFVTQRAQAEQAVLQQAKRLQSRLEIVGLTLANLTVKDEKQHA